MRWEERFIPVEQPEKRRSDNDGEDSKGRDQPIVDDVQPLEELEGLRQQGWITNGISYPGSDYQDNARKANDEENCAFLCVDTGFGIKRMRVTHEIDTGQRVGRETEEEEKGDE